LSAVRLGASDELCILGLFSWLLSVTESQIGTENEQEGTFMSRSHKHVRSECLAVGEVLNRVGDKWSVLVVALLGDGKKRFSELRRTIEGISQRMLTLTLKGLARDGLITRAVYPTIPPRVEYELTRLGRSLLIPITGLGDWAAQNRERIQTARERYDAPNSKNRQGFP
jgi:DNA-binding HxlR family transcriptional regulator